MARVQVKSLGAGQVTYKDGSAYSNAEVTITVAATGLPASLYSDATSGATLTNPTRTNNEGEIPGYLATDTYRFVIGASDASGTLDDLIVDAVASADAGGPGGSAPTGSAGGSLTGTYPNPTIAANAITAAEIATDAVGSAEIAADSVGASELAPLAVTDAEVAAANKDGAAGTPSLRTLGVGALQAMPGNAFSVASWQASSADQGVGQATIPTGVSTAVMASNAGRLEMTVVNISDTVVYLALGAAAQANKGVRLNANGGSYSTGAYTGAVNAFHSGSSDKILAYVEI